ncbi:BIIDXI-like protein At5g11420 [Henckelia pumila]|uniref:BIIDXI-like protein At5g11420 n=1 Tax=Henckelia pumila TaxID=405737 RepID=UPI003C6DD2A4
MVHVFHSLLFSFMFITLSNAADVLQNPDFEIPPSNITENSTSQFLLLHQDQNPIPGWSFNGTVWYVTPAANLSLPGNGHAIQLGENGQINQTFKGVDDYYSDYILTFTLAAPNEGCLQNSTAVNVSVLDQRGDYRSQVFSLGRNLSRSLSVNFGFYLGYPTGEDSIHLEIKSVAPNSEQNVSCWPIIDNLLVRRNGPPIWYNGNIIPNGDFEVGPPINKNSSEGILLQEYEDPNSDNTHILQRWSIFGTVKYIDSKHFKVPQGKAAIELISGSPSGIRADFPLGVKQNYNLLFTIGDANDSCVGDLLVFLQVGNDVRNFTLQSNGLGSVSNYSVSFVSSELPGDTAIVFYREDETWATDGVLCGPVLDNIALYSSSSNSGKMELWYRRVIFSLVVGFMIIL